MTRSDITEIAKAVEDRMAPHLEIVVDKISELAAMKAVEVHYKYCSEQRKNNARIMGAIASVVITAAIGIFAALR